MREETIITRLEESIRLFEAYEREIWPDQCKEALEAVRDLQTAIEHLRTPGSFIEVALLSMGTPANAPIDRASLANRIVDVEFARAQADDVRLALAAYQPHGRSKAMRYLQARQYLVGQLRRLLAVAAKVLATPECAASPVVRPDYLPVVTTNDAKTNDAKEEYSISEQILQDRPGQPGQSSPCLVDTHGQPNDRRDFVAMTDLELQRAYQELSATIEALTASRCEAFRDRTPGVGDRFAGGDVSPGVNPV